MIALISTAGILMLSPLSDDPLAERPAQSVIQDASGVEAGSLLFSLSGEYTDNSYANSVDSSVVGGIVSVSYFPRQLSHEFGLETSMNIGEVANDTFVSLIPRVYYQYNSYLTPRTSVFGGVAALYSYNQLPGPDVEAFGFGLRTGIRHWIRPGTCIFVGAGWERTLFDDSEGGTLDSLRFPFGLSVVL